MSAGRNHRRHHGKREPEAGPAAPDEATPPQYAAMLALVFLSGFAALVYELLWFRQLGLIFGNTAQAAATVLSAFMLGLAWGAQRVRHWVARVASPLRLFGAVEAGIGLYALLVPAAFAGIQACYVGAARHVPEAATLLTTLRFVLALIALLVPTTLMGASLPALAEAALRSRDRFAARLGLLYGSNTAGAAAGVLACGFALVPEWGVRAANLLAAATNLLVGAAAFYLARGTAPARPAVAADGGATDAGTSPPASLLLIAALCGFLALAFETVWFRALVLVFGSTSHSFAIMVAGFLAGLAIGSAVLGRLADRRGHAGWALGAALCGIGVWTLLSMRVYPAAPELFLRRLVEYDFTWRGMLLAKAAIAAVFLLPLALFSGLAFTAVVRLIRDGSPSAGRAVGAAFSVNALGSAAGAVAAGFVMLPALGIERSLLALGAAAVAIGVATTWRTAGAAWRIRLAFALLVVAAAAGARVGAPAWDPLVLSSGAYFSPRTHIENGKVALRERLRSVQLLFYGEGATATIAVTRAPDGRTFFSSDGKVEADASPASMVLQRMMGHLPMLLHRDPRRVLNIGLGAGVTSGALTCYPGVQVDVADIEPVVTNVAAIWAPRNHDVLGRGRIHLIVNDGRNHLLVTTSRYDVITSDPFEPVVAGAASLYTVEHFRLARARLAPAGLMAQFLPLYELSLDDFRMILRSFVRVFPRSAVFFTGSDTILLGMTDGAELRLDTAVARFDVPEVRASLVEIGVTHAERLFDMFAVDIRPGTAGTDDGPVNTDDLPHIEYSAPKSALDYRPDANLQALLDRFEDIPDAYLAGLPADAADAARRGHAALRLLLRASVLRSTGHPDAGIPLLREAWRLAPQSPIVRTELAESLSLQASDAMLGGRPRDAIAAYRAVLEVEPRDFWSLYNLVWLAEADGQKALAEECLRQGMEAHPDAPLFVAMRGRYLGKTGDIDGACRDLRVAAGMLPRRWDIWDDYAHYLDRAGRRSEAEAAAARAAEARAW